MKLQELIGELLTLSYAYPAETQVRFRLSEIEGEIVGISLLSTDSGVNIIIEEQA
jgi:hypothetical protein